MSAPKIIIISPDRHQAGMMCACLQDAGYQASALRLADDALADLCSQNPDLVLLEWNAPDLKMLASIRRFRQESCLSHVPLILFGVDMREEDVWLALEAGADQCWREPFNPRVLVARLRAYFRREKVHGEITHKPV